MDKTMTYDFDTFRDKLVKALRDFYSDRCDVIVRKIPQNNDSEMTGISLVMKGDNTGVTVYAEKMYEQYLDGASLGEIVLVLVEHIKKVRISYINMDFLHDYDKARKQLFFKLLNRKRNATVMESCPYEPFLDLILVPCCFVQINEDRNGLIQITNQRLEEWRISKSQLFSDTWKSSRKISGLDILTIQELMGMSPEDMAEDDDEEDFSGLFEPYNRRVTVTNTLKFYGASVIAFPENQEELSRRLGGDYYLLPSSVHEWIAVPVGGIMKASDYAATVRHVNRIALDPEEILSYGVYHYDAKEKRLAIAYQG